MDFDRTKVVAAFLAESEEGLQRMEQSLIAVETDPANTELLHEIFRVAHTMKGNASALDFPVLAGFAHAVEDLLEALRNQQVAVTHDLVSLLLSAVDALRALVPAAAEGQDRLSPAQQQLKQSIGKLLADGRPHRDLHPTDLAPSPQMASGPAPSGARSRTLRVDVSKLDQLLNLTGEIAIAQGRLRRMMEELGGEAGRDLLEMHRESDGLYKDLQEQVMDIRMVPVGPLFNQLVRAVRDLSQSHNKLARLEIVGDDVEVDTRVLEHLKDPLLHMIRNAVDHGIEPPQERQQKGKNPCGTLTLKAFHSAGNILIQLCDDGAGFSRERILAKARSLGLMDDGEKLSDQEVYRLVFQAGFSTVDEVTDLSGRGVGMDVVRRNIDALRGSIEIQSREGEGATITIRLPLTLAVIDGFSVIAGDETYIIPLEMISECLELPHEQISSATGGVISLRGEPLPYIRLRDALGAGGSAPQRENVVVLTYEGGRAGLAVDVLLGESQAIIKPLSRLFRQVPGISGSTILADGRVALILDVSTLLRTAITQSAETMN
ncbi:MAG TPA: chemotaxis protein CheA [Terriglobales bacterium]|nr:chemotaxis protein CheA [Terriglobales bacterium]